MRKLFFIIIILSFFCSCGTVEFVNLDVRKPAPVTFSPGTRKILIVDNSFKPETSDSVSIYGNPAELTNLLLDSIRPALTNSMAQFMNEEGIFDTVEVYPYYPKPLYTYYENDSLLELPLTREEVQDICYRTESDALISLDYVGVVVEMPVKGRLMSKIGTIIRCYSADGDTLVSPMARVDSLITLSGFLDINVLSMLVHRNTVNTADLWVNSFIPKWENQERVFFGGYPDYGHRATQMADNGFWGGAYYIWIELFENEKNKKRKIKYACNAALASEFMDKILDAQKWINTANDLLSEKDNDDLAKHVRYYKGVIDERVKEMPILINQLQIEENMEADDLNE